MKQLFILLVFVIADASLYAQETPPSVPPVKIPVKIKTPILPQQPLRTIGNPKELPSGPQQFPFMLKAHTWSLSRWWITGSIGHSVTDPSFKFIDGGAVSCHLSTPEAITSLQSGTYTIHGNNVTIILKKDANVVMTCNLLYDVVSKTLTGSYSLQVLPITNPPSGYTPCTVTGDMKLEIKL